MIYDLLYLAAASLFACVSVCLSVCLCPHFFRHDRQTATVCVDISGNGSNVENCPHPSGATGGILGGKKCHEPPRKSIHFLNHDLTGGLGVLGLKISKVRDELTRKLINFHNHPTPTPRGGREGCNALFN